MGFYRGLLAIAAWVACLAVGGAGTARAAIRDCVGAEFARRWSEVARPQGLRIATGQAVSYRITPGGDDEGSALSEVVLTLEGIEDRAAISALLATEGRTQASILQQIQDRERVPLVELLPEGAAERTGRYAVCEGPNCRNAALYWHLPELGLGYTNPGQFESWLVIEFDELPDGTPLRFGDLITIHPDSLQRGAEHAMVYVDDRLVWHKASVYAESPWVFETLESVTSHYYGQSRGSPITFRFFRKKPVSAPRGQGNLSRQIQSVDSLRPSLLTLGSAMPRGWSLETLEQTKRILGLDLSRTSTYEVIERAAALDPSFPAAEVLRVGQFFENSAAVAQWYLQLQSEVAIEFSMRATRRTTEHSAGPDAQVRGAVLQVIMRRLRAAGFRAAQTIPPGCCQSPAAFFQQVGRSGLPFFDPSRKDTRHGMDTHFLQMAMAADVIAFGNFGQVDVPAVFRKILQPGGPHGQVWRAIFDRVEPDSFRSPEFTRENLAQALKLR